MNFTISIGSMKTMSLSIGGWVWPLLLAVWIAATTLDVVFGQYEWQTRDTFDAIRQKMDRVTRHNCEIVQVGDLYLPMEAVSHRPDIKEININPVFPNRTQLLHIHNMALSRAFFWSYILQSRFIRPAVNDTYDPGMMYYFLSTLADVSSNPHVNASAIYFAPHMFYSSSYLGFFNKTFARFAPRTYRLDDFNDAIHLQPTSTLNTFFVDDLGAVTVNSSQDYTSDYYRINEWYRQWLPDQVDERHDTKTTYQIEIRYANNTNESFTFHGPPGADENPGPVAWTRPYFDCGGSNTWKVAAVVPIADIYPRHTGFRHIEYPRYTAVSVTEMDFERIDINQCPAGMGNPPGRNLFEDTARCRKETTECEPLHGWGFRRGGYQCRCRPGFRLQKQLDRPFLGEIVERATEEQFYNGFNCLPIGWKQKVPAQWEKSDPYLRHKQMGIYRDHINTATGPKSLKQERININNALAFILGMNKDRCRRYSRADLVLSASVMYGAETFFENEAKMALRLANFISAFLQINDPTEASAAKRLPDKHLTEDQMIGETLSLVLGNSRIWSAGTYWDQGKFNNRTLFAPYAYKTQLNARKFNVEDLAIKNRSDEVYLGKPWFADLKEKWLTNFQALETFNVKLKMRLQENSDSTTKYERYPIFYRGAKLEHGIWTAPYYDCYGKMPMWKIKYAAPFFGWDSLKAKIEFKGVVAITTDLLSLDINQCPDKYSVPNAFKETYKCDQPSSYCVPILGRGFESGGYKCECKAGFEYPFDDLITYYDGQLVEAEFSNLVDNNETRFNMFKCRLSTASGFRPGYMTLYLFITVLLTL